jgi:hypothetical protein
MLLGKVKVDVSGIRAVVTAAKKRDITLKGAKAAAKVLLVGARGAAPKRKGSGALKQAQGVKAAKGNRGSTVSYAVQGARKKVVRMVRLPGRRKPVKVVPAFYDHLVQLGTRPHSLAKGSALARTGRRRGAEVGQDRGGKHPGAKPNPYRKRVWVLVRGAAAGACLAAMGRATQKEIDRQVAKYGRPKG